ncbi:MAG: HAD-IA family hydrolase [Patescibacteria group bacterium]
MSTKCILFDADGVVIDSQTFSIQYQKQFGLPDGQILPFFQNVFPPCLIGQADLKQVIAPYLPGWKWTGTVDEFLQFWFKTEHHLNQPVISIIKELRNHGIKCFLVTNQEKYRTEYMKHDMGFNELFDDVYSSSAIGHKKPAPEFFHHVLHDLESKYHIHPTEIMYFDDTKSHIDQARQLGIDAYFYENYDQFFVQVSSLRQVKK